MSLPEDFELKSLHDAALSGDLNSLESLLQRGANPNALDELGRTALNCMCSLRKLQETDLEVLRLLIKHGADVNTENNDADSPSVVLFNSQYNESDDMLVRIEALKLLLENGADVTRVNNQNLTILKKIILCNPENPDTAAALEVLLKNGTNPNMIVDEFGNTILNFICDLPKLTTVYLEMIKLLIQYGANVNTPDEDGNSPMMNLLNKEFNDMLVRIEALKILLKNGANVACVNHEGQTIFRDIIRRIPATSDTAVVLELLLQNGADPNMIVENAFNETALNFICRLSKLTTVHLEMIKILIQYRADVNTQDKFNFSPIMSLFRFPENYNLRLEIFMLLLENQADVTLVNLAGDTILHIMFYCSAKNAAKNPCIVEEVKLLLRRGVDVKAENKIGQSAFDVAVKDLKHPKVIKLLSKVIKRLSKKK